MPDLFANVSVVECVDSAALDELLSSGLDRFVVRRLSDRAVVVDHEKAEEILRLLRRQGQTPKVTQE